MESKAEASRRRKESLKRKKYEAPRLARHGNLKALTASTSYGQTDMPGMQPAVC